MTIGSAGHSTRSHPSWIGLSDPLAHILSVRAGRVPAALGHDIHFTVRAYEQTGDGFAAPKFDHPKDRRPDLQQSRPGSRGSTGLPGGGSDDPVTEAGHTTGFPTRRRLQTGVLPGDVVDLGGRGKVEGSQDRGRYVGLRRRGEEGDPGVGHRRRLVGATGTHHPEKTRWVAGARRHHDHDR
jgi:hypothetical protein